MKVLNSFFLCFKKPSPSVSSSVSLGSEFIHGLRKFSGSLGKFTLNTWEVFDYLDDILEDSGELDLTEGIYNFTPKAPVLQLEHHNATLAANTQMEYVPTPPTAANHTEWIKGQNAFFVPYDMVPQVIGKGLTPRQLFMLVVGQSKYGSTTWGCQRGYWAWIPMEASS